MEKVIITGNLVNPIEFDEVIKNASDWSVYQTWAWGEARNILGFKPYRYVIEFSEGSPIGISLQEINIGMGIKFLLAQGSPALGNLKGRTMADFAQALREIGQRHKAVFIVIEPYLFDNFPNYDNSLSDYTFLKTGFQYSLLYQRIKQTMMIDLRQEEDSIFSGMKKSHRRDIRRAARYGVKTLIGQPNHVNGFYKYYKESASKNDRYSHPYKYWEKLFYELINQRYAECMIGIKDTRIESVSLYLKHANIYQYYYMSSNKNDNLGSSYLVMWEAIKRAKLLGYSFFEVTYISTNPGLQHWKGGFGGKIVQYLGPYEMIISPPKYNTLVLFKRLADKINKNILKIIKVKLIKKI